MRSLLLFPLLLITFLQPLSLKAQVPTLVKDAVSGSGDSNPVYLTACNGKVYFQNDNDTAGTEPWVSDGTAAGTHMIKDVQPTSLGSDPRWFTEYHGKVYFKAQTLSEGAELWVTDGTDAGTHIVKDINPGTASSYHSNYHFTTYNDRLYFYADDGVHGFEIWSTDGTDTGTRMLKDCVPGIDGSSFDYPAECNGRLFYQGYDFTYGRELWVTDGTDTGTHLFKDIFPGAVGSTPGNLISYNNKIVFVAQDTGNNFEPWITDGTDTGTHMIKDIYPGTVHGSSPQNFFVYNGLLYFNADDSVHGTELWVTDGTETGTYLFKEIIPGSLGYGVNNMVEYNNKLYLLAYNDTQFEFWIADGNPANTTVFYQIPIQSSAGHPVVFDNKLFFVIVSNTGDGNIWVTDSLATNTHLVRPAGADIANSLPTYDSWPVCNNSLYFPAAYFTNTGYELYKIDTVPVVSVPVITHRQLQANLYPNPASNYTQLHFTLDDNSLVSIELTDVVGKVIKTTWPVNRKFAAGEHTIKLILEQSIAPGNYIVTIHAGNASNALKLRIE